MGSLHLEFREDLQLYARWLSLGVLRQQFHGDTLTIPPGFLLSTNPLFALFAYQIPPSQLQGFFNALPLGASEAHTSGAVTPPSAFQGCKYRWFFPDKLRLLLSG